MFVAADSMKCTGCGVCQHVCSFSHIKELTPSKSFLRLKRKHVRDEVITCTQCGICAKKCPSSAISFEKGVYAVDSQKCIGCGICVASCPFKVMVLHEGKALKCDLCKACIEWCPVKALSVKGEK